MSWSALPVELNELVIIQARCVGPVFERSLSRLSCVDKATRAVAIPHLFDPLTLHLVQTDIDHLFPSLLPAKLARAARINLYSNEIGFEDDRAGECMLKFLSRLSEMPSLTEVELEVAEEVVDWLETELRPIRYLDHPQPQRGHWEMGYERRLPRRYAWISLADQLKAGAVPGLLNTARQISKWLFGPLPGRCIALSSISIRHLVLRGVKSRLRYHDLQQWEMVDWEDFQVKIAGDGNRSGPEEQLELIHPSWRTEPFLFLSTLSSLTLSFPEYDLCLLPFVKRFSSLSHLDLTFRDHCCHSLLPTATPLHTLSSLSFLRLRITHPSAAIFLLDMLDLPSLTILALRLTTAVDSSWSFSDSVLLTRPSIARLFAPSSSSSPPVPRACTRTLRLEKSYKGAWTAAHVAAFEEDLLPLGVRVEPSWPRMYDAQPPSIDERMEKVAEVLEWATRHVERMRRDGAGEAESEEMWRSIEGLERFREVMRQ
ncbi:hypothetical protein JCM8547_008975 [Rhodosporidiobolus lusitaniae]